MTAGLRWSEDLVMGTQVKLADSGWQNLVVAVMLQVNGIVV